jgi:hypothetical protein
MTMSFDAYTFARETQLRVREIAAGGDRVGAQHLLSRLNGETGDDEENAVRMSLFDAIESDGHVHRPRKRTGDMGRPPKPWYV